MILINQFPDKSYSLNELLNDLRADRLNMGMCYFYSAEGALNLAIDVQNQMHQSLICSWLMSKGYMYTIIYDNQIFHRLADKERYSLVPKEGERVAAAIPIFCAGLLKTGGGKLVINFVADEYGDRYSMILFTTGDAGLREICYAFGMKIPQDTAPSGALSNKYNSSSPILSLPYSSSGLGMALTCGYGKGQASVTTQQESITIGGIYNDVMDRTLCMTDMNLLSSTAIYGAPGYGKTTLISSLIYQIWEKKHIPFIVIEPKREYRSLKRIIPELKLITSLAGINPLLPPKNVSPDEYVNFVLDLMEMIVPSPGDSPMRDYFRDAYFHCIQTKKSLAIPDYLKSYSEIMSGKYSGDALNFVQAGFHKLKTFFMAFCGPRYMQAKGKLPFENLRQTPIVIELGDVTSIRIKSAYTYYLFQHIRSSLRRESGNEIDQILVLEEAHMVLDPSLPIEVRREIGTSLAEDRARGLSIVVSDQSPSRLDQAQMCLAGNLISFRLLSQQDRACISESLGISGDQLNNSQKQMCWIRTNSMYGPSKIAVKVSDDILSMTPLSNEEYKTLDNK